MRHTVERLRTHLYSATSTIPPFGTTGTSLRCLVLVDNTNQGSQSQSPYYYLLWGGCVPFHVGTGAVPEQDGRLGTAILGLPPGPPPFRPDMMRTGSDSSFEIACSSLRRRHESCGRLQNSTTVAKGADGEGRLRHGSTRACFRGPFLYRESPLIFLHPLRSAPSSRALSSPIASDIIPCTPDVVLWSLLDTGSHHAS